MDVGQNIEIVELASIGELNRVPHEKESSNHDNSMFKGQHEPELSKDKQDARVSNHNFLYNLKKVVDEKAS